VVVPRLAIRVAAVAGALLLTSETLAKRNVPDFPLEYRPTQTVGTPDATLHASVITRPVALELVDARETDDPARIGTRTDDDDELYTLTATNDVTAWVEAAVHQNLQNWGIRLASDADRVLRVELVRFSVDETNQAVGAMYSGNVRLRFLLQSSSGAPVGAAVIGSGEATRYGKKFSADNANEVLSDALIDAVADAVDSPAIHDAWRDDAPDASTAATNESDGPAVRAMSPDALLREVRSLLARGIAEDIIVEYVRGRALTAPLGAEEILVWNEAGVPEAILRAAVKLPVH